MTKHALILSFLIASVGAANAQAPPAPTTPPAQTAPAPAADNCAPTQPVPPRGTISPEGSTTGEGGRPPGKKPPKSKGGFVPPTGGRPENPRAAPAARRHLV